MTALPGEVKKSIIGHAFIAKFLTQGQFCNKANAMSSKSGRFRKVYENHKLYRVVIHRRNKPCPSHCQKTDSIRFDSDREPQDLWELAQIHLWF